MNEMNCENAMMTMMAELDGEKTEIPSQEQAAEHLAGCHDCRREFEQMRITSNLLRKQTRREHNADLWRNVERRLETRTKSAPQFEWQPFLLLGALLVVYKLLEMLPARDLGFAFKFV